MQAIASRPLPFSSVPATPRRTMSPRPSPQPSPHHILYITNQKLATEISAGTPNLRRLVLCANTYDRTVQYQAQHPAASPPRPRGRGRAGSDRPEEVVGSDLPPAFDDDAHTSPAVAVSRASDAQKEVALGSHAKIEVLEVPEELEFSDVDMFDVVRDGMARDCVSITAAEVLFADWDYNGDSDSDADEDDDDASSERSDDYSVEEVDSGDEEDGEE